MLRPRGSRSFTRLAVIALSVAAFSTTWALASPANNGCAMAAELGAVAAPDANAGFVASINALRQSQGLNALIEDGNLDNIAQDWAVHMAADGAISHRTSLAAGVTADWKRLGENVGFGPGVSSLMEAFIASPHHYENLVDPRFTRIGVGTVNVDGLLYTAHEFMSVQGDGAPSPAPAPAPAAAPSTPRVTSAPRVRTAPAPAPAAAPVPTTVPAPTTTTTAPPIVLEAQVARVHMAKPAAPHTACGRDA
jgi:uncharacterized protein YkwD